MKTRESYCVCCRSAFGEYPDPNLATLGIGARHSAGVRLASAGGRDAGPAMRLTQTSITRGSEDQKANSA